MHGTVFGEFAKGIALGMARHFGGQLEISDLACLHRGAATCEIVLRRTA